jgi:hypothetical protein
VRRVATPWQTDPDVARVEALAEQLLVSVPAYIWDGECLPIPVEDIADSYLGLLVRDVDDLAVAPGAPVLAVGQSLSGLLLPDRGEIWVDAREASQWPPRRRFTIAHELGHWQLHRKRPEAVFCRASAVDEGDQHADPGPERDDEWEANVFAAALLMPAQALREQYVAHGKDFARLCRRFGASGAAMGRRLHAVVPPAS